MCEISKEEIYKISQGDRGPGKPLTHLRLRQQSAKILHVCTSASYLYCDVTTDYGLEDVDPDEVPTAPKFSQQPEDTVYEPSSQIEEVWLECVAECYPAPQYKWYKFNAGDSIEIDLDNERCDNTSCFRYYSSLKTCWPACVYD